MNSGQFVQKAPWIQDKLAVVTNEGKSGRGGGGGGHCRSGGIHMQSHQLIAFLDSSLHFTIII